MLGIAALSFRGNSLTPQGRNLPGTEQLSFVHNHRPRLANRQRAMFTSKTLLPSPAPALVSVRPFGNAEDSPRFYTGIVFVELQTKKHGISRTLYRTCSR